MSTGPIFENAPLDARVSETMTTILAEIPVRLGIRAIAVDAHRRLVEAAGVPLTPEVAQFIAGKVAEVLREVAAHAVDEFEQRTGQSFLWHDDEDDLLDSVLADSDPDNAPGDGT